MSYSLHGLIHLFSPWGCGVSHAYNRRPPRSSFHPPQYTVVANSGGGVKDDSAPPSGGVGSPRWRRGSRWLVLFQDGSWIPHFRHGAPSYPSLESHTPLWWGAVLDPAGRPRPTSRPTPAREGGPLVVESDKDVDWYVRLGARRVSSMRSLPWAPPVIKASIPRK